MADVVVAVNAYMVYFGVPILGQSCRTLQRAGRRIPQSFHIIGSAAGRP
jgi:hypothetical protein